MPLIRLNHILHKALHLNIQIYVFQVQTEDFTFLLRTENELNKIAKKKNKQKVT